jgi:hypothetical protein
MNKIIVILPLHLGRYTYPYSKPLIVANFYNGKFSNTWCDTVYLRNVQVGIVDGTKLALYVNRVKYN